MNSLYIIFFWLSSFSFKTCYGTDTITLTQPLKDPQTLVSSNGTFKLGFFSPSNSSFRYLGICYNQPSVLDFVWVANRNTPLNDTSGVLRVSEDGNLYLLNGQNQVFWSSNVSNGSTKFSVARILDSGNLVLLGFNSMDVGAQVTTTLWQSFEHPTDAALPIMKLPVTQNSDVKKVLWSWKSPSDPAYGRFSMGTESSSLPQLVIYDGDRPYWRSGPWNGNIFIGIQYNISNFVGAGFILENDRQGTGSLTYSYSNASLISNYVLTYQGLLVQQWWDKTKGKWEVLWQAPETECDVYGKCGVFGCCNTLKTPICRCMKGFEPKNKEEWSKGNWTSGCKRRKELKLCGSESGQEDGFFRLSMIKVPDKAEWLEGLDEDECRNQCLKNCSCLAYVYDTGAGCMSWSKDIVDTEEFSNDGVDLYLRLAHSEFGNNSKMIKITTSGLSAVVIAAISVCFTWRLIAQRKGKKIQRKKRTLSEVIRDNEGRVEIKELPLFEYEKLVIATNNFHESNKLGRGGFGPVYKGRLERGQEIAVKRLSKASGQGNEEFMNEVMVISKLQHRNLVRLLGCCVEAQEKMLIYEYLPNKSLDDFLSDPLKRELLTWPKRFKIIKGICRGLLYLHRDSRLRIIHRDIKAGNILLDDDLNPKISDFGMARIFGGNQDQADTRRVVGTYGYMSPEYAMEGRFSEKSDVYSFGVLMLEIVSGKKNSIFWHDEQSLSLLGYVWKQWNEDDMDPVIDPVINESSFKTEIKKCIQVGLLCVQEFAKQRPTISTVISMLTSDVFDLPRPRKPAFTQRQRQVSESSSLNYVSFTELSAR